MNMTDKSEVTLIEEELDVKVDPIDDIIDYLVRCARISFKNPHVNGPEIHTSEKIRMARQSYMRSPTEFLLQFGKYLSPNHIEYFDSVTDNCQAFRNCIRQLKEYHSDSSRRKRVRNRRFKALQKLQNEGDYFSDKQMMYRNPLLYEQLIGQYLTDDEVRERDSVDNGNISLLNLVLETVDRNHMTETKNEQLLEEELEMDEYSKVEPETKFSTHKQAKNKRRWGDFEVEDTQPSYISQERKKSVISAPERKLLREEFCQEMYNSFIEGRDLEIDYFSIDNDETYDDLQQLSQDAEDKYFDSETNDVENLEEHMKLVEEYGRKNSVKTTQDEDDPLDIFMKHMSNKISC